MDRMRALLAALALGAAVHGVPAPAQDPLDPARRDPTAKIASRAELEAYLAAHATTPFDALSPGGRERFLYSLRFGGGGIIGMDPNELADALDDAQIRSVVVLFGESTLRYAPKSRVQEVRAVERRVTKHEGMGPLERRYTDYYKAMRDIDDPDPDARTRRIGELFDARLAPLYEPQELHVLDDHELRLLRLAVRSVSRETRQQRHIAAFERLFAERARRDLVSTEDVDSLRELFVALRRFADARALTQRYHGSGLKPLPQFRDELGKTAAGPTVWRLDESGRRLTRTAVDLGPLQIVVTASCHFSKDAARDIGQDAVLGPVFARHAHWLVPAPGYESVESAQRWNAELPATPVVMVYDRAEWSVLPPRWVMPTFYVVRDGRIIDSTDGWATGDPAERADVIALLRRNGLLPAQ